MTAGRPRAPPLTLPPPLPRPAPSPQSRDAHEPGDAPLGVGVKLLVVGLTGTGKSELINCLLERPASRTSAFRESTKGVSGAPWGWGSGAVAAWTYVGPRNSHAPGVPLRGARSVGLCRPEALSLAGPRARLREAADLERSPPTPRTRCHQVRVLRGDVRGISLTCIDTPGLHASSDAALANKGLLRSIARAYKKHKPDFVLYVDR